MSTRRLIHHSTFRIDHWYPTFIRVGMDSAWSQIIGNKFSPSKDTKRLPHHATDCLWIFFSSFGYQTREKITIPGLEKHQCHSPSTSAVYTKVMAMVSVGYCYTRFAWRLRPPYCTLSPIPIRSQDSLHPVPTTLHNTTDLITRIPTLGMKIQDK